MKNLKLHEVRNEFLKFFESKNHLILKSFSLIPKNDDSLLLIGAGMAPLKKYFTGELIPPSKRITDCQKCIRTGDIERVGKTDRHATFFEMLGNFSFGDYFKKEAIHWAWEFLTNVLEMEKDRIWVTVYEDDQEAFSIWNEEIGIDENKILRLGKDDNFWELEVGPSGPCTEIFYDRGLKFSSGDYDINPSSGGERFIEVWNLVFTQFDKDKNANYNPLKNPNIDTGMGLERITSVLQEKNNIFEIDAMKDIINAIENISNIKYKDNNKSDISFRVLTDHIRAITFLISDKVKPSNEGRGYVLRRLIRRAYRYGKKLNINGNFLYKLADSVIYSWGKNSYPELLENRDMIVDTIKKEENKFSETLEQGIYILNSYMDSLRETNQKVLSGEKIFKLYDTYGFPEDLTEEILKENEFSADIKEFNNLMNEQKERARAARNNLKNIGWSSKNDIELFNEFTNEFIGYNNIESVSQIIGIVKDNELKNELNSKEEGIIILNKTPFYGEGGGQIGDTGIITSSNFKAKVLDTKKAKNGVILHIIKVLEGHLQLNETVEAKIDKDRRHNIARNHSVTHLLHKALKEVLGDNVNQAGSEILDLKMRFDFSYSEAISKEQLSKIEKKVNELIFKALPVSTIITNIEEVNKIGATALFEEKYSDIVRIVKMGDSTELCGGTHVKNTSEIGIFKILSESSVSAGVRRIESITGPAVYNYLNNIEQISNNIENELKVNKSEILNKIIENNKNLKNYKKEINELKIEFINKEKNNIYNSIKEKNGIKYLTYSFKNIELDIIKNIAIDIKNNNDIIIVFSILNDNKLNFICCVSENLIKKNYHAGNIIKEISKITKGNGGGKSDLAIAGGKDISKINEALLHLEELL